MALRPRTEDAFIYTSCVYDQDGNMHLVSHIYEMFISKRLKTVDKLLSYDGKGFAVSTLKDIYICQVQRPYFITTRNGRKQLAFFNQRVLTPKGFVPINKLGIGSELTTFDHNPHMNARYGFRKYSLGYLRLRAFLRNHMIGFEEIEHGSKVGDRTYYCVDYDIPAPIYDGDTVTLGLNNFREFLMQEYNVGITATDVVVDIRRRAGNKYPLGLVLEDGPQNLMIQSGLAFTTQQELM